MLTDPRATPGRPQKRVSQRVQCETRSAPRTAEKNIIASTVNNAPDANEDPRCRPVNPLASLSPSVLISACDTYRKKFPVANFLHYPSLIANLSSNPSSVDPVFLASLLSLCARFLPGHGLDAGETYAAYARTELARRAFEAPSLYLAQSLVMITFYEWGSGHPYRAWMYSGGFLVIYLSSYEKLPTEPPPGMATYMIQSLLKTADDSMEHNPDEFHASQIQYEQLVRTYWCCFAQDCELSSGARQHFALSFRQISVPLPISDNDFNFGRRGSPRLMPAGLTRSSPLCVKMTIDRSLAVVTRGFDIFVRILRFANESRRARASSATMATSSSSLRPTWQNLKGELDEWRSLQDVTLRYPATSAQAHVAFGYGELFAYINLIYFMRWIFIIYGIT